MPRQIRKGTFGHLTRDRLTIRVAHRLQAIQSPAKLASARRNLRRHDRQNGIIDHESHFIAHPPQNADPRGKLRRLDFADQPARESRHQLRAKRSQFLKPAITSQDQLPPLGGHRIKRVQQFLNRPPLAGKELQVVDRQQLGATALLPETGQPTAA